MPRLLSSSLRVFRGFAVGALLFASHLAFAAEKSTSDDVITLDAVGVDERTLGRTYYFAEVPGFELLSPFPEKLTQAYAHEFQRQRALLTVLIPELAGTRGAPPQAIILDDQAPPTASRGMLLGKSYALDEGVLRQSLDAIRGVAVKSSDRARTPTGSTITWSRAAGPDATVFYTSIHGFDTVRQSSAGGVVVADRGLSHIFPLPAVYEHRRPRWPQWIEDGIDTLGARFFSEQTLSIFMVAKLSPPPLGYRIEDLFAPPSARDTVETDRRRFQAIAVFFSWALVGNDGTGMIGDDARRDAFWRFAERAARERVTPEMFTRFFGPDAWSSIISEWSLRVGQPVRSPLGTYWPQKNPTFLETTVRRATRAELVRIKSEYEWRIAREFAAVAPELAQQCIAQAGLRLRKAYADGERDPRFLAVLALYEADVAGAEARPFVEAAAATHVVRPELYIEQARFRFADEQAAPAGPGGKLSVEQVRRVLEAVEIARKHPPVLREVYQFMSVLWSKCAELPPPEDLRTMAEGLDLFPRDPVLAFNLALLHVKAGDTTTAAAIATRALPFAPEGSDVSTRLRQLQARSP